MDNEEICPIYYSNKKWRTLETLSFSDMGKVSKLK